MGFQAQTSSPQSVAIVDRSRIPKDVAVETIEPIIFYLTDIFASCENAMNEGTTIFHVINAGRRPLLQPPPETLKRIVESSAFKMKNIVVARSFDHGQEHMLDYLAFEQERQSEKNFGRAKYVIGNSLRETLNLLEENGLDRSCIPLALGGDYFYSTQFNEWIRERLSIEGSMLSAPPVRNTSTANAVASKAVQGMSKTRLVDPDTHANVSATSSRGSSMLVERRPGESSKEFEKRRHHVYGKRSYQKKRQEADELRERRRFLRISNAHLQIEHRRLESLLAEAIVVLAPHLKETAETTT